MSFTISLSFQPRPHRIRRFRAVSTRYPGISHTIPGYPGISGDSRLAALPARPCASSSAAHRHVPTQGWRPRAINIFAPLEATTLSHPCTVRQHGTVCSRWVRILKTRLKVTSVFMAIWPHPHAFKHQASTAAQRLDPAVCIEQGRNQCCATPEGLYDD